MLEEATLKSPLGTQPVGQLLVKFAVPSIISTLVAALYNIVDQFFIGQSIGELGNAATNVAFPLSTSCVALSLLFGLGGAAAFNLTMGEGDRGKAAFYAGNALAMLTLSGIALCVVTQLFLTPMLRFFGSPDDVLSYAETYTGIVSWGFPFLILSNGGAHLIRADGSPRFAMFCNLSGALLNTVLDPLLIFGFDMGMEGAALATIAGQIVSCVLAVWYLRRYKTVHLGFEQLRVKWKYTARIMVLGTSSFCNQIAMMVVQIVMNNSLAFYGAASVYGQSIPLACAGIITKVNQVFFSVNIGIAQGMQPIAGFNYGAKQYARVIRTIHLALLAAGTISCIAFLSFQLFPEQIISLFGEGSPEYVRFAVEYFRIYLFCTFLNFIQPITSTFFTVIGKPLRGMFLSLTRQILFLLPLILIFPIWFGIDGIMYAGPIADFLAAAVSVLLLWLLLRNMRKTVAEQTH